jgi:hypothetical protein
MGFDKFTERSIWGVLTSIVLPSSLESGITAEPAGIQGDVPLTKKINEIDTVASSGDSVTLYDGILAGISFEQVIINNGANPLGVFPALGHDCGAGANAKITVGPNSITRFTSYSATEWKVG